MKILHPLNLSGVACIVLLNACSHTYYIPHAQNLALFKQKGDFKICGIAGGGDYISTCELQSAYAITNNVAIAANFMQFAAGTESQGTYKDVAVAYYLKPVEKLRFEIFGGYGIGRQHHDYSEILSPNGSADLSYRKFYVQPALGWMGDGVDLIFSMRIAEIDFYEVENNVNRKSFYYSELVDIEQSRRPSFIQPALTLRLGWQYIKVQCQVQRSFHLGSNTYLYDRYNVGLGLQFALSKSFIKK